MKALRATHGNAGGNGEGTISTRQTNEKGPEEFKNFLEVLHRTERQSHVADIVEKEMSKQATATLVGAAVTTALPRIQEQSESQASVGGRQETLTLNKGNEKPEEQMGSSAGQDENRPGVRGGAVAPAATSTLQHRKRVTFFVKPSHRAEFRRRRKKLFTMCCQMFAINREAFKVYYEVPEDVDDLNSDDWHAFVSENEKVVCLLLHGISKTQFDEKLQELLDAITTFLNIESHKVEVSSKIEKSMLIFICMPLEAVLDLLCAFGNPILFNQLGAAVQAAIPMARDATLRVGNLPSLTLFTRDESLTRPIVQPTKRGMSDDDDMFEACRIGHYELVEDLLSLGVSPNISNEDGQLPIHVASYNNHVKIVELFLQNNIAVDCQDQNGGTPLHSAAVADSVEVGWF